MSIFQFFGKYILYLFNLLCLISGIIIITIAVLINQKFYNWSSFISKDLITAPQIMLVIGLIVFAIAILGLCGIIRDSGCLLILFSVLLTLVLMGELIFSGAVLMMRGEIKEFAMKEMNQTISKYNQTGYETSTEAWNILQSDVECCGINGPNDWKIVTHTDVLPVSCCKAIPVDWHCTKTDAYLTGCFTLLEDKLQENSQLLFWTGIAFAAVQLLAVTLACCRRCSLYKEYETV
ncbi:tetraspanin-9-like [Daktulosphaira vitifoliae]|uniref:tetraspanin-9-like n=1 Tax=Daktulosphaira vitifoliae TaxID=58002 RepID=UPI0021A97BAD|nr:tetraspanin-9-like [Daktulosphaira vitifoliae]XP_050520936.1 tetraspanin-9-like [Daktulosphaira vitifoliae]